MMCLHHFVVIYNRLLAETETTLLRPLLQLLQCRRYGGARGTLPPNGCLRPPFWFTQNIVFGTSRNDKTMMERGLITFKHNSPMTFSRFFAK